jgi:peptidoglycan-associated lipoprotein
MKGGEEMLKRTVARVGIVMLIIGVSFMFLTGCAKKAVSKDEALIKGEQTAGQAQAGADVKQKEDEAALKEKAAREQALREQELREQAIKEQAMKADAAAMPEQAKVLFEDVYFQYDQSNIDQKSRDTLKLLAEWLQKNKGYSVVIEGNCDDRGAVEYNLALGQRRADAAMKYLVDLGINQARIKTVSYGKERPVDAGQTEEAWAKNRRDHFVLSGKK